MRHRLPWGAAQTVRELRRRIADDTLLRGTAQGLACRGASLYELENTRVTLRVVSPSPAAPAR